MRGKREVRQWLSDILDSADIISAYLEGIPETEFFNSISKQDAVLRRLSIIGEAVSCLPAEFKKSHTNIEWSKAAGMRNILIHEYFDVDNEIIWDTLTISLPVFRQQVAEILKDQSS